MTSRSCRHFPWATISLVLITTPRSCAGWVDAPKTVRSVSPSNGATRTNPRRVTDGCRPASARRFCTLAWLGVVLWRTKNGFVVFGVVARGPDVHRVGGDGEHRGEPRDSLGVEDLGVV